MGKTAEYVKELAKKHNIEYVETALDVWAKKITELSGDDIPDDPINNLIVELERKGVITKRALITLVSNHIKEREPN